MDGINNTTGPAGLWSEARNPQGRVYYYNTVSKATQWTKPVELMTPAEVSKARMLTRSELTKCQRALASQPWQEYTTKEGRKYWYNKETKQSSWEMPGLYKDALAQAVPAAKATMP